MLPPGAICVSIGSQPVTGPWPSTHYGQYDDGEDERGRRQTRARPLPVQTGPNCWLLADQARRWVWHQQAAALAKVSRKAA